MTAVLAWLRGLLAVGLLAGFYVLAFLLVAVDLVFVALVLWAAFESPSRGGSWTLVVGGSIPALCALVYGVATVSRAEDQPPGAVFVRRREAPGLWRLVENLAEELGTRPPTRIFLTPEVNAAVSEEAQMLGFVTGQRTMYIGVPLLLCLKPAELRAVLCHEFGHYAAAHTRFGAVTYRGAASLDSTLFRLRMTAQAGNTVTGYAWLFLVAINAYAKVYLRLSLAVRRRQELEADRRAAAMVGPAVTSQALRTVHALDYAWSGFLDMFVRPVQRLGFVPTDLFATFESMVDDPMVQQRLAALREHPVEANRSRLDSHPPLTRRLERIEALPADAVDTVDEEPLFADRAPVLRVQKNILAQARSQATALPLAEWTDLAAEAFPIELASLLLDAARGAGVTARPTLATVLDVLERGGQRDLADRLTDAPEPAEQLAEALYALVGQVLVGAGRARWELSWTTGYLLVRDEETGPDLVELVAAAAREQSAVAELRQALAVIGVAVEAPVRLALRTVSAPAGRTTGVRITGHVPDFVAEEVGRQRAVSRFTVALLLILAVPWLFTLIGSGGSEGSAPSRVGVPYDWSRPTYAESDPLRPPVALPTFTLPPIAPPSFALPPIDLPFTVVVVKRGDTLTRVACRYRTTVKNLQELNDMGTRTRLHVGQTLIVPTKPGLGIVDAGCR